MVVRSTKTQGGRATTRSRSPTATWPCRTRGRPSPCAARNAKRGGSDYGSALTQAEHRNRPRRPDTVIKKTVAHAGVLLMGEEHQALYGFRLNRVQRFTTVAATCALFAAASSKAVLASAVSRIRASDSAGHRPLRGRVTAATSRVPHSSCDDRDPLGVRDEEDDSDRPRAQVRCGRTATRQRRAGGPTP